MNKPTIGFIGLGLMGSNIAECLQNNGFDLVVMGRNKEAVAKSVARGAVEVTTPKALAGASDIVMLCVTTSEVVESLVGRYQRRRNAH
jgi:3-hydroxyisobutyrate dehydrogenase